MIKFQFNHVEPMKVNSNIKNIVKVPSYQCHQTTNKGTCYENMNIYLNKRKYIGCWLKRGGENRWLCMVTWICDEVKVLIN